MFNVSKTILQVPDIVQITVDYINYNVYYSFKIVQVGNIKFLHNNDNSVTFYMQKLPPPTQCHSARPPDLHCDTQHVTVQVWWTTVCIRIQ